MSSYVAQGIHITGTTGVAQDSDPEMPVTSDQNTQTDEPNDESKPRYVSKIFDEDSSIPMSYQNSLNEFLMKRQYEADDDN